MRFYDNKIRSSVVEINTDTTKVTELLSLPSEGDNSYVGVVLLEKESYYSSHEGKTSIYFAEIDT